MIWFNNDGGPLLVAPMTGLDAWEGADPPSGGRVITVTEQLDPDGPATDYDRACDVMLPAGVVSIGQTWGAVISAEVSAGWLAPGIVAVIDVDEDSSPSTLRQLLNAVPAANWKVLAPSVAIDDHGIVLLHSACTLPEVKLRNADETGDAHIPHAILSPIAAGDYCIEFTTARSDTEWDVGFLRFRRLGPGAA